MPDKRVGAAVVLLLSLTGCGSTVQQVGGLAAGTTDAQLPGADGLATQGAVSTGGGADAAGGQGPMTGGPAGNGQSTSGARTAIGVGGSSGSGPGQPPAVSQLPPTGRGWDQKFVYVGVNTQKDAQQAFQTVGVNGVDGGNQEAQAQAVADDLNRRGGLFGRQIKLVFRDHATVATAQDPNSVGNATCVYFTQDRPVVALISPVTLLDVPSFRSCMAKGKVPLFSASVAAVDSKVGRDLAPYFYQSVAPAWDSLAPVLARQLQAQGYFAGWNPRTGAPGPGPAKLGLVVPDDEVGRRVEAVVLNAMQSVGVTGAVTYRSKPNDAANSMNSAVLQFAQSGVTHVATVNADLLAFMLAADSQGYRPRYAVTSYAAPTSLLETAAPARQLTGAVGVGWSPSLDVNDSNDPGSTGPGETECLDILKRGGQTFQGKRLAEAVAFAVCDGLRLVVTGSTTGGGLAGEQIFRGILANGSRFSTAFSFANGIRADRLSVPGAVRPLAYVEGCRCFQYTSTSTLPL